MTVHLPCSTCGATFAQDKRKVGRHSRFCSDKCRHVAKVGWSRRDRASSPQPTFQCRGCGKPFIPPKQRGRLLRACSSDCRRLAKNAWRRHWRSEKRGVGSKVQKPELAEPAPPARADFFLPTAIFEGASDLSASGKPADGGFCELKPAAGGLDQPNIFQRN